MLTNRGKLPQVAEDDAVSHAPEEQILQLQRENEALRNELRLARELTNASIDCIMSMDTDLNITAWNDACEAASGFSKEDVSHRNFYSVFPDAAANEHIRQAINYALQGFKSFIPASQGAYLKGHFESHFVPLKDNNGHVRGILLIMHDVAHRIKHEEKLSALNRELVAKYDELKRANAELATFTHITSHDLKEPLRKIYIFIEIILSKDAQRLSNEGRANMRRVQASVQQLSLLADSLVSFSEIRQEPHKQCSLNHALRDAITLLKPRIKELHATIDQDLLPEVNGSEWQFRLLFQQLLSNALKFQEKGNRPAIKIAFHPAEAVEPGYFAISVTDNGIGIEPEYHERIFDLFFRLHGRNVYPGVGMGLALVRKIVERHNGFVRVSSPETGGVVFTCYFPADILVVPHA